MSTPLAAAIRKSVRCTRINITTKMPNTNANAASIKLLETLFPAGAAAAPPAAAVAAAAGGV